MIHKPTAIITTLLATAVLAAGAPEKTSSVINGAGGRSSGGSLELVSSVAQPGGVKTSRNGDLVLQAGFLNTFSLKPELDTDGDGLANEADPDNDNDGLGDEEELAGSAFIPATVTDLNNRDSDGDGASDGDEAGAGTNPQDNTMYLHITSIAKEAAGGVTVAWQAKAGKRYAVYALDSADAPRPGTKIGTDVTATGGTGPWYATHAEKVDAMELAKRFYYVKVVE